MTLVELMVSLLVLSLLLALVLPSINRDGQAKTKQDPLSEIALARQKAVTLGNAITLNLLAEDTSYIITLFPDGSIIGAQHFQVDQLSGAKNAR